MNEPEFASKPRCNALERVGTQSAEELVKRRTAKATHAMYPSAFHRVDATPHRGLSHA
jgi:hypothetical protein